METLEGRDNMITDIYDYGVIINREQLIVTNHVPFVDPFGQGWHDGLILKLMENYL